MDAVGALSTWKYKTDRVAILPFTSDSMPDVLLPQLYATCKRDGTWRYIFPESSNLSLGEFMSHMYGKTLLLGMTFDNKILGFGWLWEVKGTTGSRRANVGFSCFREGWGTKKDPMRGDDIRAIARLAIGWWFCEAEIEVIYGSTLATNKLAQKFAMEVGFSHLATLPKFFVRDGKLVDAALFCVERDRFIGGA